MEVKYHVSNLAQEEITGQAIRSVALGISAAHFKKIECFCFTQQTLKPGETREMPVRFVVERRFGQGRSDDYVVVFVLQHQQAVGDEIRR